MRDIIVNAFIEIMREHAGDNITPPSDETVLLESGLDSLGFAALVARLEQETGLDPFTRSEVAYYPRTFGEFVAFYERYC